MTEPPRTTKVDATLGRARRNMNNLSFVRHDEFIMQLIIFLMGRCEFKRQVSYEIRMADVGDALAHASLHDSGLSL